MPHILNRCLVVAKIDQQSFAFMAGRRRGKGGQALAIQFHGIREHRAQRPIVRPELGGRVFPACCLVTASAVAASRCRISCSSGVFRSSVRLRLLRLTLWKNRLSCSPGKKGPVGALSSAAGQRDLDDFGPQLGQHHRAIGPRAILPDREDAHAGKRRVHSGFRFTHWRDTIMRCISFVPSPMISSIASR